MHSTQPHIEMYTKGQQGRLEKWCFSEELCSRGDQRETEGETDETERRGSEGGGTCAGDSEVWVVFGVTGSQAGGLHHELSGFGVFLSVGAERNPYRLQGRRHSPGLSC